MLAEPEAEAEVAEVVVVQLGRSHPLQSQNHPGRFASRAAAVVEARLAAAVVEANHRTWP